MVVDDLNVVSVAVSPSKANSPLVVDPNAVLTPALAPQPLESVARWDAKVFQARHRIEDPQLPQTNSLNTSSELPNGLSFEELLSQSTAETLDHDVP